MDDVRIGCLIFVSGIMLLIIIGITQVCLRSIIISFKDRSL